ncbi:MAG: SxtJ family membrane protein [Bacteroidota bacterium]
MNAIKKALTAAYRGWMAFARFLGIVNTTILLTLVYILLIGPLSLVMRAFGSDLLDKRMKAPSGSFWRKKAPLKHTLDECRHQF